MPETTLVAITITVLALLQFMVFGALVGRARGRYGVKAPAVSGNEIFERYFRVQMNTLEQLVMLLPALWVAAAFSFIAYYWIALIGLLYLVGRILYLRGYVADPKKRELGFLLSSLPISALIVIDLIGVIIRWVKS